MGIRVGKVAQAFNKKDEALVKTEGRDILSSLKKALLTMRAKLSLSKSLLMKVHILL
jgi:hypothetical protein